MRGGRGRTGASAAWRAAAAGIALVAASVSCAAPAGTSPQQDQGGAPATVKAQSLAPPPPVDPGWPRWGITHTQVSADNEGDRVVAGVTRLLGRVPMLQNQHIMGFGVDNPEPSPGRFDFTDLDSRVTLMDRSGGLPVITLCCAPDWMKGGAPGQTDWNRLTTAPDPAHFDDFAKLAAAVAKRYPNVRYYMVWNEFKGFLRDNSQHPDAEGYTALYNKVYTALKAVNPDIKVGGPYIPINSHRKGSGSEVQGAWGVADQLNLDAVEYWLEHKKGADFIVVDGASVTEEHTLVPDEFGALDKFAAVTKWLRDKSGDLPVWWAEWYVAPDDAHWQEPRRLAVQAVSMMEFATSGAATVLYWSPQVKTGACPGCLWSPANGSALPTYDLISGFTRWFPAGVALQQVTSSDPKVRVLAQKDQLVMVNTTAAARTVTVDGKSFDLRPYQIKWTARST
jgi:hypothetical protein